MKKNTAKERNENLKLLRKEKNVRTTKERKRVESNETYR